MSAPPLPSSRSIVLVSQVWRGHIPAYHRSYALAFAQAGWTVREIVFPEEPAPASRFPGARWVHRKSRSILARFPGAGMVSASSLWRRTAREVKRLERETGSAVSCVFFVYLDLHFLGTALPPAWVDRLLPRPWAGIVVHPRAAYGERRIFPGAERVLQARHCRAVAVLDYVFVAPCQETWPGKKVVLAPDLTDITAPDSQSAVAKEIRAWIGGHKAIGLVGAISTKKNVSGFVALARRALAAGDSTRFVIAGLLSEKTARAEDLRFHEQLLRELPANCRAWTDGLEEGGEFNAVVSACDAIFVAYRPAPENSNVLTKAAYFQKPVLASAGHLMADAVRNFQLGEVVVSADSELALLALRRVLDEVTSRKFAAYFRNHSDERLRHSVAELLSAFTP